MYAIRSYYDALIDNVGVFTKEINPSSAIDKSDAVLWLNFESESREGNFYSYGIGARTYGAMWPNRKPQPEMWQMKKTCQPLAFRITSYNVCYTKLLRLIIGETPGVGLYFTGDSIALEKRQDAMKRYIKEMYSYNFV